MRHTLLIILAAGLITACGESSTSPEKGALPSTPFVGQDAKGDVSDHVTRRGALVFGQAAASEFVQDKQLDGHTITLSAGAKIDVEVTQRGSSRGLDTTLWVFGPRGALGYGSKAIAFDDDDGWGQLSRIRSLEVEAQGEYLIIVGTYGNQGRGRYQLLAACLSEECAPLPVSGPVACHPEIAGAVLACVAGKTADTGSALAGPAALDACLTAEVLTPAYDTLCAGSGAGFCQLPSQEGVAIAASPCRAALTVHHRACLFGDNYHDLQHLPGLGVESQRMLGNPDGLDDLDKKQILAALVASDYDDIATINDAFDEVDEGIIWRTTLFDQTGRRGFVVYEFGLGDNSYGAYFAAGGTDWVARIGDGDVYDCTVALGVGGRPCVNETTCSAGQQCWGVSDGSGLGRCANVREQLDGEGNTCSESSPCPEASGLLCAGASWGGEGLCSPAWMRDTFVDTLPTGGLPFEGNISRVIDVRGLATADTDVWLAIEVQTSSSSETIQAIVTNPGGTDVPLDPSDTWTGYYEFDGPVDGFTGDEEVNGSWTVHVRGRGVIKALRLTVGSRWD